LTGGKASGSDGSRRHAHHHGYCRKTPAKPEKLAKDFTPEEHRVEAEKHASWREPPELGQPLPS
jgi:hypothetical protein